MTFKTLTHSTQFKPDSDGLWAAECRQSAAAVFKESSPNTREGVCSDGGAVGVCRWATSQIKASCFAYESLEELNPSQDVRAAILPTVGIQLLEYMFSIIQIYSDICLKHAFSKKSMKPLEEDKTTN